MIDLERSAAFSNRLIEWLRGKGRILIVAHDNPDPDSLAAAFALQHLITVKHGREAAITFGGVIGRRENQEMVKLLEINATPLDRLDLDEFDIVCMVDTQPGTGNNSFPADREVHIVIDHHPVREATHTCRWVDVRENYGASATILFEYLLSQDIYLGTKLATILFYAIKSETQDLGREWCRADREAYLHLIPLCNNRILHQISHPQVPQAYFSSYVKAIRSSRIYGNVLVFNLLETHNPDIVAEMADFLLRMEDVDIVLGMGNFGGREILSLRTTVETVGAGRLMKTVLDQLGTAGGHGLIAGGQIQPMSPEPAVLRELEKTLTRRLLTALGHKMRRGRRLQG